MVTNYNQFKGASNYKLKRRIKNHDDPRGSSLEYEFDLPTFAEIGKALGITAANAFSGHKSAMRKLRQAFEELDYF